MKTYFKFFKTSWGILIGIEGDIVNNEDSNMDIKRLYQINENLYLYLNINENNKYIYDNKIYLIDGIKWVEGFFPVGEKKIVRIDDIDLNFCNFQIEGLFLGIAYWLSIFYNKELPRFEATYSRELNKYVFSFG